MPVSGKTLVHGLKVVKWKIWYDNGETFSSEEGTPEKAPLDGILIIVQKGDHIEEGEHILNGGECYRFVDKWYQGDKTDLEKWLQEDFPLLMGRLTDQQTWRQAKQEAIRYAKL